MIPEPLYAIILLIPQKAATKYDETKKGDDSNSFFLHQNGKLVDACGTIAMVHNLIILVFFNVCLMNSYTPSQITFIM
jgi:hypothetical protein